MHRLGPLGRIDTQELRESVLGEIEALGVEGLLGRDESDGRIHGLALPFAALHHPLEHADVVPVAGPEELAVLTGTEPVHAEDLRRHGDPLPHLQPVAEVVAHVVAGEREHRHRVAAQDADLARGRCRGLRGERRAEEHAVLPGARLEDEGNVSLSPGAEEDGGDRDAFRILPVRRDGGALLGGGGEAAVGMRRLLARGWGPRTALPVEGVRRRRVVVTLPPWRPIGAERDVGVDGVLLDHLHGVRIGLAAGPRDHAEEPGLGIDGPEAAVVALAQPGDVVAHRPHFPARLGGGRDEHGEVGLPARAGEGAGDVVRLSLGSAEPEDELVLGEPAFLLA